VLPAQSLLPFLPVGVAVDGASVGILVGAAVVGAVVVGAAVVGAAVVGAAEAAQSSSRRKRTTRSRECFSTSTHYRYTPVTQR
jgi:hypothetical protein